MDFTTKSTIELKSIKCDLYETIQNAQIYLQEINKELAKREQEKKEESKEVKEEVK